MVYLTVGEGYSGVYKSQVIDVCIQLENIFNKDITLISVISLRNFTKERQKIKSEKKDAIVIPMVPQFFNWTLNIPILFLFFLFNRKGSVISRNVIATNLCLLLKKLGLIKNVCYDGRGAVKAERKEYLDKNSESNLNYGQLEYNAVMDADFRMAVSNELVNYWKDEYGYKGNAYIVIPCTVSFSFEGDLVSSGYLKKIRKELGFSENDIVLVYAGSIAAWQSFNLISEFLKILLESNKNVKVLFLSKKDENIKKILKQYPDRIVCTWVKHNEVPNYLGACDYGLLLRENSTTNRVAAPTKFAEYLSAGLSVIISDVIVDYASMVKKHNLGIVIDNSSIENINISPIDHKMRTQNIKVSEKYFSKKSEYVLNKYAKVIEVLDSD